MKICGLEFTSAVIDHINQKLNQEPETSRRRLARFVCERMDWKSVSGRYKETACRKALILMGKQGIIMLADCNNNGCRVSKEVRKKICQESVHLECTLDKMGTIDLELITYCRSKSASICLSFRKIALLKSVFWHSLCFKQVEAKGYVCNLQ